MKSSKIKEKYIEFFKKHNHQEIINFSLVPENDPTVLFTTAGMHPLVPYLLGQKHPQGKRLVNTQKCIRTQDIDEVGDNTHLTFFEMLGNWSLGDYWKEDAIKFIFEFLTMQLKIPKERIAISIFKGDKDAPKDTESETAWLNLGIKKERIKPLIKKENWWGPAGEFGPCGPDTEIFVYSKEKVPKEFDTNDKNWVEVGNNVFMQYNKTKDGYKKLKQKNVDFGGGYERLAMILQNKSNVFETDLFNNTISKLKSLTKIYDERIIRIIADHLRTSTLILGELIKPSNIEQGYILRRLLRRSIRYGKLLNMENFIPKILKIIIKDYKKEYPYLEENKEFILTQAKLEEKKFQKSLEKGLREFNKLNFQKTISGRDAFYLFQSFGFPIEIIKDLAKEKRLKVDEKSFEKEFTKHQRISRVGSEKKFKSGLADHSDKTTKLHTATHLLNQALKDVLKQDIKQMGSNITQDRLRFDFSFPRKLTKEEIIKIENKINNIIKKDLKVTKKEMLFKDTAKKGISSFFKDKYPEKVTVYYIGNYSKEVCTGPHITHTKELGHFKIKKEQSSSAGVRRIKAILE